MPRSGISPWRLTGTLVSGEQSALTFDVARDGSPVTTLRARIWGPSVTWSRCARATCAYLHVHPVDEPGDGVTAAGPQVRFIAQPPTEGRYLLYLDFQVDGQVHTAEFEVSRQPLPWIPDRLMTGTRIQGTDRPRHQRFAHRSRRTT